MTSDQILADFNTYIGQDTYSAWYAGIAGDPEDCLFNRHSVARNSRWIYRPAASNAVARFTEAALLRSGLDGGPGGGDDTTVYVYAYRKTSSTSEG